MKKTENHSAMRMLTYIVPHWHLVVASTIAGVIKMSMPLILPQVIGHFTDELLVSTNYMSNTENIRPGYISITEIQIDFFHLEKP